MPNWCNNSLTIEGDKKTIDTIYEAFMGRSPFKQLIGYDYENYSEDQWYEHNNARFGTKWEPLVRSLDRQSEQVMIANIDTAWTPPIAFVLEMCENYGVSASMDYEEIGVGFRGRMTADKDGNCHDYTEDLY